MFKNKNDKQFKFNEIKGLIEEINIGEKFNNITLKVGHENSRSVNLVYKKENLDINSKFKINDKVAIKYFLTSRKKDSRWYTTANILDINLIN